jgi:hypothetical protein
MNITLIADGHPREWPILRELETNFPNTLWIQPRYHQSHPDDNNKKSSSLIKKIPAFYYRLRDGFRRRIMKRIVDEKPPHFKNKIELPWYELETKQGRQLIRESKPDVLITCRAPILKDTLLDQANWCGINVHFGIVPNYRGNEGLFWAALQNDHDSFGGSIHLLTPGVDTGRKLVDAYPALDGYEMLAEIEVKVSKALAKALTTCLEKLARIKAAPTGKPQGCIGRNYRASERTFGKDLFCFLKRRRYQVPERRARQKFYF